MAAQLELVECICISGIRRQAYTKHSVDQVLRELEDGLRAALSAAPSHAPLTIEDFVPPSTVSDPPSGLEEGYTA